MTYEDFSLFVNYENRREQFPKHIFEHSALFQIMGDHTHKTEIRIDAKEERKLCKYIINSNDYELDKLRMRLSKTDAYINGNIIKPVLKQINKKKLEITFK